MAVRIRKDGSIVCAAFSDPEYGDRYIDDKLHYQLSAIRDILRTDDEGDTWYLTEPIEQPTKGQNQ